MPIAHTPHSHSLLEHPQRPRPPNFALACCAKRRATTTAKPNTRVMAGRPPGTSCVSLVVVGGSYAGGSPPDRGGGRGTTLSLRSSPPPPPPMPAPAAAALLPSGRYNSPLLSKDLRNTWDTGSLSLGSGLTHPCSTDVDMEPFSTSVNEVLS